MHTIFLLSAYERHLKCERRRYYYSFIGWSSAVSETVKESDDIRIAATRRGNHLRPITSEA